MAKSSSTARKRERERMKVEKATMKRERRDQRKSERLKADTERGVDDKAEGSEGTQQEEHAVIERMGAGASRADPAGPSSNPTSGTDSQNGVGRNEGGAVQ